MAGVPRIPAAPVQSSGGALHGSWRLLFQWLLERFSGDPAGVRHYYVTGSPEGVVTAPVGSTASRLDGGVGSSFYVKEADGTAATGWAAK